MSVNHLHAVQQRNRPITAVALLFLLSLLLSHPGLMDSSSSGNTALTDYLGPRVRFANALELRQCAQLQDLRDYGVNLNLFAPNTVYLNSEYFCSETAPAQYQCRCGFATTCKAKRDPWGRNIGVCDCCSSWMIACFIVLAIFSIISFLGAVYVVGCQGKWWCDGYVTPKASLMPRRGPTVSCPPSRPLPENLFRGYASVDFTNSEASLGASVGAGTASASPLENSPNAADPNHEVWLGSDAEDSETRV
ncbi:hypothetical protein Q4I28_000154 [Leishmania naiffi]|uniref:Enriched in surface-labeled proteome protein 11 n=1 Tax=Leishmania naiffi TaxID=5678 RepID=A0AAW3CAL9_9TRYP